MTWQGKVTITARLTLDYEFGPATYRTAGNLSAKNEQDAKDKALEFFKEDIIEMAYQDPNDLCSWLGDDVHYEIEAPTAS